MKSSQPYDFKNSFYNNFQVDLERNPELNLELKAETNHEEQFEQEYLNIHNFLRASIGPSKISLDEGNGNQLQTNKKQEQEDILMEERIELQNPIPFDQLESSERNHKHSGSKEIFQTEENIHKLELINKSTKNRTATKHYGQQFLKYLNTRKFIQQISKTSQRFKSFKDSHYEMIADKSSDITVLKEFIKTNKINALKLKSSRKWFKFVNTASDTQELGLAQIFSQTLKKSYSVYKVWVWNYVEKVPLIYPESKEKIWWDYIATLSRSILLILIPLEISFHPGILFKDAIPLTIIQVLILVFDMLIRLNTVLYLKGNAVSQRWQIFTYQLKNSVSMDCFGLIPLLCFLIVGSENGIGLPVLLVFFMQFRHIFRVIRLTEESAHLTKAQQGIVSLIQVIITLLFIGHLFSCIWFYNSIEDSKQGKLTWITYGQVLHATWVHQYIDAFYYSIVTMLTIGYGDIVPQNPSEKILTIFFILIACIWFSYAINAIGNIIKEISQSNENRKIKMRLINKYMKNRKIPFSLQFKQQNLINNLYSRIREYLNFCWKHEEEEDMKQENILINQLSDFLKDELEIHTNGVLIKNCPLLQQNFSATFLKQLSKIIKRVVVQPENRFNIQFELNENHLCYLEQGSLILQIDTQDPKEIPLAQVVNTGTFLNILQFINDYKPDHNYKAIGSASLLTISKSDFFALLKHYPQDYQRYCEIRDNLQLGTQDNQYESCSLCLNRGHSFLQCQFIKYIPDKELIIKRHLYTTSQSRIKFNRPNKRRNNQYSALLDKEILNEFCMQFQIQHKKLIEIQNIFITNLEEESPDKLIATTDRQVEKFENVKINSITDIPNSQSSQQPDSIVRHSILSLELNNILEPNQNQQTQFLKEPESQQQYDSGLLQRKQQRKTSQRISMKGTPIGYQSRSPYNIKIQDPRNQIIEEFNRNFALNIQKLIKSLNYSSETSIQVVKQEVDLLRISLEKRDFNTLDTFEALRNFEQYMVRSNINLIIPDKEKVQFVDNKEEYFHVLCQYMNYPSTYIQRYRKNAKRISPYKKSFTITKSTALKMNQIKNIFLQSKQKKVVPERYLRHTGGLGQIDFSNKNEPLSQNNIK